MLGKLESIERPTGTLLVLMFSWDFLTIRKIKIHHLMYRPDSFPWLLTNLAQPLNKATDRCASESRRDRWLSIWVHTTPERTDL